MNSMKKLITPVLLALGFMGGSLAFREKPTKDATQGNFTVSINDAKNVENVMPIVIIGSGPAALSAALYGSRGGVKTLVIRGYKPGGALTETSDIENWPGRTKILGSTLMNEFHEQVKAFGTEFLNDTVSNVDASQWPYRVTTEGGKTIHAMAVIVATGSTPKTLGISGEQEYWGKGVTTCAVCDAPFCKDKDVVVIGGGDTAAEEAMQLAPYAKNITILVRKNRMRASATMQDRLKDYPNISISYNKEVTTIAGDANHVAKIEVLDNASGKTQTMPIHSVFLAIGHTPNTALVKNIVTTDQQGYILLNGRSQQTSKPFIYAAGDVADDHYKQAGVAAGDGIKAALDAVSSLQELGYSTKFALALEKNLFNPIEEGSKPVALVSTVKEVEAILAKAQGPVILDFFAEYCPSCMRMLPALESVAHQLDNQAEFYKVDMGDSDEIGQKYNVTSIPALLVFNEGKLVSRYTQAMNKKQLHEFALRFVKDKEQVA